MFSCKTKCNKCLKKRLYSVNVLLDVEVRKEFTFSCVLVHNKASNLIFCPIENSIQVVKCNSKPKNEREKKRKFFQGYSRKPQKIKVFFYKWRPYLLLHFEFHSNLKIVHKFQIKIFKAFPFLCRVSEKNMFIFYGASCFL